MELPVVGNWSSMLPTNWSWSGTSSPGLTHTGGALGTPQTLYGNNVVGTLTSDPLLQTAPGTGTLRLHYWSRRANTGSAVVTARLYVDGAMAASATNIIATGTWTQYTLNYGVTAADAGRTLSIQFEFANGGGGWQVSLDEVTLDHTDAPLVAFAGTSAVQQEAEPTGTVTVVLSKPATNTVTVNYAVSGGTAVPGANFTFTPGVLTFDPGVTSRSFQFSPVNDQSHQQSQTVEFALSGPVNAVLGAPAQFTVKKLDPEDQPPPATYYVDSAGGNDSNIGNQPDAAWQTLAKVNATTFLPGDAILLKAGSTWTGQLHPKGSGTAAARIVLDRYDSGPKPLIHGGGLDSAAVLLQDQQYWTIRNLEITNNGTTATRKKGILILNNCTGTLSGIEVRDCDIHDVTGVMSNYADGKESGGIVFFISASNLAMPSKWTDIVIENNTVRNVDRSGILMQSLWINKPQDPNSSWGGHGPYVPSTNIRIAGNIIENVGGDGIIPWCVGDSVIEHNFVRAANNNTLGQGHAGVWPYFCENVVFQFNEVCETKTKADGMAFNFDNSNQNCIYQYNYSHDNEGGFLNMCSDGNANGNIARYNISQNDGCLAGSRVFLVHGDGNHGYKVYNNTIYVKNGNPAVFLQGAPSNGSDIEFKNNLFINLGTGSFIAPGGCTFDGNLYFGKGHIAADLQKILADPKLALAGSGGNGLGTVDGYKLQAGSPALDAGLVISSNGGRDYWGNPVAADAQSHRGAFNGSPVPPVGLIWDVDAGLTGAQDGPGTWSGSSNTWWSGTTTGPWTSAENATIGSASAAAGTITLGESITATNITFLPPASGFYQLVGNSLKTGNIECLADAIISSVITGTTGMTKSGVGMLSLAGVSTYTGGTIINNGTLSLESSTTNTAIRGAVTVNSGGTLRIAGANWGGFGGNTGTKIDTLNVVGGSVNHTLSFSFIRDAGVNMTGGMISGGEIHWRNTTLNSLASAETATVSSQITLRNDFVVANLVIDTANGAAATDLTVSGVIGQASATNAPGLIKSGDGTLELTAISTFTGGTTVNGGNLLLNHSTTNAAIRGTVTVNTGATLTVSGASFGGFSDTGSKIDTLNVVGGNVVVVGQKVTKDAAFNLTGGTISGGTINLRNTALNSLASATTSTVSSNLMIRPDFLTPTLTIDVADGAAATDLRVNGSIQQSTPSGNLIKTGTGTLVIANNCSYTGTTTVSGGTLATGWYLASNHVTVASGATLAGNGGIGGNVTIQSGGHHALAVAASSLSQVTRQIGGSLTWESGTFLDLTAAVPPAAGTYVLLTATGGIAGPLPTVSGLSGSLAINGNNLELTVTSNPFSSWAQSKITAIDPLANATPTGDPDADGVNNLAEFAFNGNPLNGSDNGYRHGQTTSVPSVGSALILTFATRAGANFGTGPTATADDVNYTVQGSLALTAFASPVTKVTPAIVPPGWPAAASNYGYHTFRLDASTGLAGKGFLRVKTEQ